MKIRKAILGGIILGFWIILPWGLWAEDWKTVLDSMNEFIVAPGKEIISLDMKEVPLSTCLRAISEFTGINFLASEEIEGLKITLRVKEVSVNLLLEHLFKLYGLQIEKVKEDFFVIKPKKEKIVTKVFFLKYVVVPGSRIIEKSKADVSLTGVDTSTSGGGEGGISGKGLFEALEAVLSEQGVAICDPRTNSILVKEVVSNMPNVERVISTLDRPVPQIMISVDMLDVSKSVVDKLGLDWSNPLITLSGWRRNTRFPFLGRSLAFWPGADRTGTLPEVDVGGQGWAFYFLRQLGDARYLARPKIFTINGETAKISISTNEAIGINIIYDENRNPIGEEAERYETGVLLEVTPFVNVSTKEITMVVIPKLIETKPSKVKGTYDYRDPEERGLKTVVRVPDGATVVLGGLIKHMRDNAYSGLPGFANLLKHLFGSETKEGLDRELLIFITPKIWDPSQDLGEIRTKKVPDRLEEMKKLLDRMQVKSK